VIASREAFKKQGLTAILCSGDYLENRKLQAKVRLLEKRRKAS
jgi:triosephosphate isomerase